MAEVTAESVLANAMGPQSVAVDGMSVSAKSTSEQLAALQVAAANRNARKKNRGLSYSRFIPGSAVGGGQ